MQHNKEVLSIRTAETGKFVLVTTQFSDTDFIRADDHDGEFETIEAAREALKLNAESADEFWAITHRADNEIALEFDREGYDAYRNER